MTEDLNVFPNAKSPIFGEGEDSIGIIDTVAVAGLSGTISQAENTTGEDADKFGGFAIFAGRANGKIWPSGPGTNQSSVTVTTPADSLVVVAGFGAGWLPGSGSGTMSVRVLDGSTTLKTATLSTGNTNDAELSVLFVGVPLSGSRTYNVQCWNTSGDALMHTSIRVSHVQFTDTHAGIITTPATATKQINAADSHTTREISVLPA